MLIFGKNWDLSLPTTFHLKLLLLLAQKHIKAKLLMWQMCLWSEEIFQVINWLKVNFWTNNHLEWLELSTVKDIILETWKTIWEVDKVNWLTQRDLMKDIGWITRNKVLESSLMITKQLSVATGTPTFSGTQKIGII